MSTRPQRGPARFQDLASNPVRCIAVTADVGLARYVTAMCGERSLILTPPGRIDQMRAAGATVARFDDPRQLARTGSDLLLLDDVGRTRDLRFRDIAGVRHLAVVRRGPIPVVRRVVRDRIRGRLVPLGTDVIVAGRRPATLQLYAVRTRPSTGARRWFSPALGVDGLLQALNDAGVRHVVLRWFEELPALPPGEDLDLLIDDHDLPAVERILAERPGTQPCDVYSVSGLPGSDLDSMAYFPPRLAEATLESSILQHGKFQVPGHEHAFLTLAYHAVYHKGFSSGLPADAGVNPPPATADHDYRSALLAAAAAAGISVEPTLAGLDAYLSDRQLRPSPDTMRRLSATNPWLRDLVARLPQTASPAGLAVFFVRERAADSDRLRSVVARIIAEGFTVLDCIALDSAARERVRTSVRGGNWGRGPYPTSGGEPAVAVVAVDAWPRRPEGRVQQRFPNLDNERLLVKEEIRLTVNQSLPEDQQCNVLHSSDNAAEAAEYLSCAVDEAHASRLLTEAARVAADFTPLPDVVRILPNNGRRARVELVEHEGRPAVRKTFRPTAERFAARERLVMQTCRGGPHLLTLLAAEPNSVTTDYREDTLHFDPNRPRLLPLRVVHAAMETARHLHDHGIALIDFTPANLVVERGGRTTVVDYEFAYVYIEGRPDLEAGYDLAGPPEDFAGDLPVNPRGLGYALAWQPYVGLTLEQLLHRPVWQQHLLRTGFRVRHVVPARLSLWSGLQRRRGSRRTRGVIRRARRVTVRGQIG